MSSAQQDEVYVGNWDQDFADYQGLSVLATQNAADGIYAETVDPAVAETDNIIRLAYSNSSPQVAQVVDRTFTLIRGGLEDGQLSPAGGPWDFFRWLRTAQSTTVITAELVTGGALAGLMLKYAEERGWRPKHVAPTAHVAPHVHGTLAQQVVGAAALEVGRQHVTAPGLTQVEADAISKAIGISYADVLRVQAAVIHKLLPGMRPGQVPEALTDLESAARVLEHQVAMLRQDVSGKAGAHVVGVLTGAQQALHGLEQAVNLLHEQIGETRPSTLHTHVADNTKAIEHLRTNVHELTTTAVPELAGAVGTLAGTVGALDTLVHQDINPELGRIAREATAAAAKLALTTDECLAQLCEDQAAVSNPIRSGGATPSLLRGLGTLLKRSFELGFAVTLIDGLLAVFDMPLAVGAVAADTATISQWAISAAGVIESDLSWGGKVTSGR